MLSSLLGIRLLLWIGKTVPRPAPYEVMNAFTSVEVTSDVDQPGDGFQLSFTIGKNKRGEYSLLQSGALDLDTRVIIGVLFGVTLEPLIDGVIYHHQVSPGEQPGTSTLTVSGRDISVMLDLKEKDEPYKNQSDSTIVNKHPGRIMPRFGILPPFQVTPTTDVPSETERIPGQARDRPEVHPAPGPAQRLCVLHRAGHHGCEQSLLGAGESRRPAQPALTHDLGLSSNVKTSALYERRPGSHRDQRHLHRADYQDQHSDSGVALVAYPPTDLDGRLGPAHRALALHGKSQSRAGGYCSPSRRGRRIGTRYR